MAEREAVSGLIDWAIMYRGRAAGGMEWLSALSELFDNSLDARATAIDVGMVSGKRRGIYIDDNGKGAETLDPFFGFGVHKEHTGGHVDPLGVHGVGGTHAILYLSHELKTRVSITSRTKTKRRLIDSTWARLASSFNERRPAESSVEENQTGATGCRIELTGNTRTPPHGAQLSRLLDNLSFRYSKAIEDGLRITFLRASGTGDAKPIRLQPTKMPELLDVLEDTFDVNGKHVALRVGIVPPGGSVERSGLHYRYSYRVIKESSARGCGDYSTARVFGFVDLLKGWNLDLHKDEITDKDSRKLYEEVFRRLEPLLKKAQGQLMVAESKALIEEVEKRIGEAIEKTQKGKRGRGKKKGTTEATGKGSGHKNAANKQDGDKMPGGAAGKVHIEFTDLDAGVVGDFKGNTIRLNTKLSAVRRWRTPGNPDALFAVAMFIYWMSKKTAGFLSAIDMQDIFLRIGSTLDSETASIDGRLLNAAKAA